MKLPQMSTTAGVFGIFNQLIIIFGPLTVQEIIPRLKVMTLEDLFFAFGPIIFYVWCVLFDEKGFYTKRFLKEENAVKEKSI